MPKSNEPQIEQPAAAIAPVEKVNPILERNDLAVTSLMRAAAFSYASAHSAVAGETFTEAELTQLADLSRAEVFRGSEVLAILNAVENRRAKAARRLAAAEVLMKTTRIPQKVVDAAIDSGKLTEDDLEHIARSQAPENVMQILHEAEQRLKASS